MATTDKNTLKNWFKNKLKPTQEQFWAWMDSYWHKSEQIPSSNISGLDNLLAGTATTDQLNAAEASLQAEINTKVDKVAGKQLSTEDFTALLKQKLETIDLTTKLDKGNYEGSGEDLYNGIQNILAVLASDDTTLDELQEIVNYIKQNKSDLEDLGISNIAGLVDALGSLDNYEYWTLSKGGGQETDNMGLLYNGYAVNDPRKITSDDNWRVAGPADRSDYTTLLSYVIDPQKLKENSDLWPTYPNPLSTNEFGFNARPSGFRNGTNFMDVGAAFYVGCGGGWDSVLMLTDDGYSSWGGGFGNNGGAAARLVRAATSDEQLLPDGTLLANYIGNNGRAYKTVKIGTQVWMAEGLAETAFRNGDPIPEDIESDWLQLNTPAMCAPNNDWDNVSSVPIERMITSKDKLYIDKTISGTGTESDPLRVNVKTSDIEGFNSAIPNLYSEITYDEAITAMGAGTLVKGVTYKITDRGDRGLFFTAISTTQFAATGTHLMLCPATYASLADDNGNTWIGVWNGEKTAVVDNLAIWGGKVWKNLTGAIGTKVDDFNLDTTNWVSVLKTSFTNFEYKELTFSINFEWDNDWISRQWDENGNVLGCDVSTAMFLFGLNFNPIEVSDWNSHHVVYEGGNPTVMNFFKGNVGCLIMNNIGHVFDNTCYLIKNNKCSGNISYNSNKGSIYSNLNDGDIKNNSNAGSIYSNSNNEDIINNSNAGNISSNSNNGNIKNNSNNGNITSNSNTGNIYGNLNDGYIISSSNDGDVTNNSNIGAIIGNSNIGNIIGNSNTGSISSNLNTGSISSNSNDGTISNNSNIGDVSGNSNAGTIFNNSLIGGVNYNANLGSIQNVISSVSIIVEFNGTQTSDISGTFSSDVTDSPTAKTGS